MSCIQEIRMKIDSVRNIQKIAGAMEMIAVSKMYKAKKNLLLSTPYTENLQKIVDHLITVKLEYKNSYFFQKKIKCVGYWVISTDRGLAGGLNINLFRTLLCEINKWNSAGVMVKLSIIGKKAAAFFNRIKYVKIVSFVSGLSDQPNMSALIGSVKVMLKLYDNNQVDRLYVVYNKFVNTLSQVPRIFQVVPIISLKTTMLSSKYWDYLYESDSRELLNILLQRYIESQIYQGVIENIASEQSARMVAMKTASDNGESMINNLKLFYNKVRQSKITQELTEIISGASVI